MADSPNKRPVLKRKKRALQCSEAAMEKLAGLGFDPLVEMVGIFRKTQVLMEGMTKKVRTFNSSGEPNDQIVIMEDPDNPRAVKPSIAMTNLLTVQQNICSTLIKYQYATVSESAVADIEEEDNGAKIPMIQIVLSDGSVLDSPKPNEDGETPNDLPTGEQTQAD